MNLGPDAGLTALDLKEALWPGAYFPDYQCDMLLSPGTAVETYVASANEMGKDHCLGLAFLIHFLWPWVYYPAAYVREVEAARPAGHEDNEWMTRWHTRRGISTSVAEKHLSVLWSMIGMWIDRCAMPLRAEQGGPLIVNDLQLCFAEEAHLPMNLRLNYAIGMVAEKPEKFQGHHARYTFFAADECSGMSNDIYDRTLPWRKRGFFISNCEKTANFFKTNFRKGDVLV